MSKPSIPKGTRDFGPRVMARRNWMFDVMRSAFERFGFLPIETPAMENLSTLTGKYGEEGDKLIFRILNNGDFLAKSDENALQQRDSKALIPSISKKALRYDLTVPFARFVVMSRNDLVFPFRRYAMANVWRGDRPGKGRYQEFTQCDADIIGTDSVLCELELIELFHEVLSTLNVPGFRIVLNDRRILTGLADVWSVGDRVGDLLIALDKLDKIGASGVDAELQTRGFSNAVRASVQDLIGITSLPTAHDQLDAVASILGDHDSAMAGISDLRWLLQQAVKAGIPDAVLRFDVTLARGLDYYTGAIFEVRVDDAPVGSICGGGRYADLTGIFGWSGMSGVGISFGADRIYDVLEHFDAFPADLEVATDVLVCRLDEDEVAVENDLATLRAFRTAGWNSELYPEATKLKKQLKFAADRHIPWVVLCGESEREQGMITLRNMASGEQSILTLQSAIQAFETDRA
jgi:histidyl-tRNA synthetase